MVQIERFVKISKYTIVFTVASLLLLNYWLLLLMNNLQGMIEAQQVLVLIPLTDVRLPAFVHLVFSMLLEIASFDYFETGELFEKVVDTKHSEPLD